MTPPEDPAAGSKAVAGEDAPAVSVCLKTLRKRADFLKASRARRVTKPGFVLQARQRRPEESEGIRIGYTCSKKVGNAVQRNRAKRRLREIAHTVIPEHGMDGWDYVLIGRRDTTSARSFAEMVADLKAALAKIHQDSR